MSLYIKEIDVILGCTNTYSLCSIEDLLKKVKNEVLDILKNNDLIQYKEVKHNYNMMEQYIDNLRDFMRFYNYVTDKLDNNPLIINFDTFNVSTDSGDYIKFFYDKLSKKKKMEERVERDFYKCMSILEKAKCKELELNNRTIKRLSQIPDLHCEIYGIESDKQPEIRRTVNKILLEQTK